MTAGAFFGDSAQTSKHLLKVILGRMFPAIYKFSIFSIRDFDGQVATVPQWWPLFLNDDLTNSFILATTLSAASHVNPLLYNAAYYVTFARILT